MKPSIGRQKLKMLTVFLCCRRQLGGPDFDFQGIRFCIIFLEITIYTLYANVRAFMQSITLLSFGRF